MKSVKVLILSAVCVFVQAAGSAELSLSDSLKVAEESSPQVRKADAVKDEAKWKKVESFSVFLPKLNVIGSHLLDEKFMRQQVTIGGPPTTILLIQPYTIWSARADWMFFDFLANYDSYRANSLVADATQKEADWARFQVRQQTKMQFYKALSAVELEKVANQNVKTLQEHLDRAKAFRQSGAGTNFDVLRVEVQLNEAQSEKLNSEDNTILARQNLLNNLGVEDEGQTVTGDLPVPSAKKVSGLQKPTTIERLDYLATQDRELSAHKAHLAAYKHWLPKFSLFGQADYYNNISKGIDDQDYNNAYQVGLAMTWNAFDGFGSSARSAQADARQVQAVETTRQARLKSNYDFDFWKRRYLYSASLYQAKLVDVEKAQESVRLATQSFKAGTRTSSEVLDAELDLFRARAGVVNAQVNAAEALVNLELAIGKEL
ncbi:TolC family protein [Bdellovibrio svalbardensis]|uniref:TolC family protein n=1 Tax=Bdellovibrio svalbardensis TaxID=2972972 RepID=A0ABT6DJ78_9BACT|nr:TolC family protein [Bdellovibrio svalbardensis]MDG0816897.1 TolC family protein [Bdellovibrio svalbardensis]